MKALHPRIILELTFRLYVCVFLSIYALGKLMGGQFYTPTSIPDSVAETAIGAASNFDLAWSFMGRSYGYILFIGISQLIGAVLLLHNRTKLLGTVILIPIMVNIIVFDVFFLDKYGALASAGLYFSMLLGILLLNWKNVEQAFLSLIKTMSAPKVPSGQLVLRFILSLILFGFFFFLDQQLVDYFGHGKG